MHFLKTLSLSAFYSVLMLMSSKNNLTIILIAIFAPLMIFTKQYSSDGFKILPYTNRQTYKMATEGLRERFVRKNIEKQKVRILEQITNNTIFVDGIPHVDIEKSGVQKYKIVSMENAFRSLLAMNGVNYMYKRGFHWRTWRQVNDLGNRTVVCYRCNSVVRTTCKNCHNGGYWVIEEIPPPCPYEIISMANDRKLCAIIISDFANLGSVCPTTINFNDLLITCNNPIETEWKIASKYIDGKSESILNTICGGQEVCEIFTSYTISPNSILFRIVNATNHVIYSRMMKSGNNNYACIQNCGIFDKNTKTVIKNEKPLIFNLLGPVSYKNKREYNTGTLKTSMIINFKSNYENTTISSLSSKGKRYYKDLNMKGSDEGKHKNFTTTDVTPHSTEVVTKTLCKKIEDKYNQDEIEDTIEDQLEVVDNVPFLISNRS